MTPPRPDLTVPEEQLASLLSKNVPAINLSDLDPCRHCDEPCDEATQAITKLEIDMESIMLGSTGQYDRMVLCSTNGKADWIREVTEAEGSLASLVAQSYNSQVKESTNENAPKDGVYPTSTELSTEKRLKKLTVLNGNNFSSHHESRSSMLVFPDYKVINHIDTTSEAVSSLTQNYLSNQVDRSSATSSSSLPLESFPIPHRAVLLICSHKTRDKKCHIAATLLIEELKRALEEEGFGIDEQGDFDSSDTLESVEDAEKRKQTMQKGLQEASESHTVGIYKCSHIAGHRYAGNVIVCLPSGSNIWYGRVTPRECEAIVKQTIIGGKVIQELLRGGVGIANRSSVLQW